MFGFFKRLILKNKALIIEDPDFGEISYNQGSWMMQKKWQLLDQGADICCIDIPGNEYGPSAKAREFLLSKKHSIVQLWLMFEPELKRILIEQNLMPSDGNVKDVLQIASLAGDSELDWEISFETNIAYEMHWTYISIAIEHGKQHIVVTK